MNPILRPSALDEKLTPVLRAERESRLRGWLAVLLVAGALAIPVFAWWSQQHGLAPLRMWLIIGAVMLALEMAIVLALRPRRGAVMDHARRIEDEHPDLRGALLSAVEISGREAAERGYLEGLVVQTAVDHAGGHDWVGKRLRALLRRRTALTVLACALFGASMIGTSNWMRQAPVGMAQQSKTPAAAPPQVPRVVVTPGDAEVERGTRLIVDAKFEAGAPGVASIVLLNADDTEHARFAMNPTVDAKVFGGVITDIARDARYRVEFEGGVSETYRIATFEYPALVRADAVITPPSWTEQPKTTVKNTSNIGVMSGSRVDFSIKVNKPLAAAELFGEDKSVIPLKPTAGDACVLEGGFVPAKSQKYRLHLVDDRDRANRNPPWITVRVLPNMPPKIELTFPKRDLAVSPVQELPVEGKVWDDLGVLKTGATFMVGGQTREVALGDGPLKGGKQHVLKTLLDLEPMHAQPKQLVSYYLWAEDRGDDGKPRRAMSDMFFAEVRSFEDIFREAEAQPGEDKEQEQQKGQQGQAEKLLELQKNVVNAAWRVLRNSGDGRAFDTVVPDVKVVGEAQGIALEQAKAAIEKAKDEEMRAILTDASKAMERAAGQFAETAESGKSDGLTPAMGSAREALEILHRAQAKEHRVMRGKQQQKKGGGGQQQQMQQQLANLELKQEDRRYEEQKEAGDEKSTAEQQENLQVLNRLKELAARQEALAQKMKELEQQMQNAKTDAERKEVERQLKRLQEEQEQMLRDMDSLKERMEKPENLAQMSEMKEKMQQAREQAREAAEQLAQQQAAQASASATKSQRQIEEVRDEFRQKTAKQFAEEMRGLKDQARKLEEEQKKISDSLEKAAAPKPEVAGDTSKQLERAMEGGKIARQLEEQQKSLEKTLENARKISEAAEAAEPALASALYDATRKAETGGTKEALEAAHDHAQTNNMERAQQQEQRAAKGVGELKENIERASEKVLGSEAEAMRLARAELDKLMKEVEPAAKGDAKDEGAEKAGDGAKQTAQNDGKEKRDGTGKNQEAKGGGAKGGEPDGKNEPKEGEEKAVADAKGQDGPSKENAPPQKGEGKDGKDGKPSDANAKSTAAADGKPQGEKNGGSKSGGGKPDDEKTRPEKNGQGSAQRTAQNDGTKAGQANDGGGGGGGWFFDSQPEVANNNPITGDGYDRWSDRLRRVEELIENPELRNMAVRVREDARQMRVDYRRNPLPPQVDALRTRITQPLAELRDRVAEELARHESANPLAPLDRDPVPARYRELVRRYYTELGAGK